MNNQTDALYTQLRDAGLKATSQRVAVLKILSQTDKHPGVEQIVSALNDAGIHMSVATVYNVLESLYKAGIVLKMVDKDNIMRFDYNTNAHVHIFNDANTEICDYFDEELCEQVKAYLRAKLGDRFGRISYVDISVKTKL